MNIPMYDRYFLCIHFFPYTITRLNKLFKSSSKMLSHTLVLQNTLFEIGYLPDNSLFGLHD